MDSIAKLKEQQALIEQVRDSGKPGSERLAAALQTSYHDLQMARVSTDVYDAAEGIGRSSVGWQRSSSDPAALASVSRQLGVAPDVLKEMLKPDGSGFRAEIYLPDPAVLGPGFKPVVAFKGSAGKVMQADGTLRDTTLEDFLANDFTQASGLRADYFTRAMELAVLVDKTGFDCEGAGHSLGGGTASAFSAISGRHSTTFNAAGLHPETARRFAEENPGTRIHDVSKTIRAYEVSGELLNDGLQDNFPTMDAARRMQIGDLVEELSIGLKTVPGAQRFLEQRLEALGMPDNAKEATRGLIDLLATGDAEKILAEMPAASGARQPPLPAMTGRDGALLQREASIGLPALITLAGPLIDAAHVSAKGARFGRTVGDTVADTGDFVSKQVQRGGAVLGGTAVVAGHVVHEATLRVNEATVGGVEIAGRSLAHARHLAAETSASIDRLQGKVQAGAAAAGADALRSIGDFLPDGLKRDARSTADTLERRGEEAQRALRVETQLPTSLRFEASPAASSERLPPTQ